jgi:hypothetical protein
VRLLDRPATVRACERAHADLQSRGVDVGEMLRWPQAPPMFAIRDQDGNGLEVVEQV